MATTDPLEEPRWAASWATTQPLVSTTVFDDCGAAGCAPHAINASTAPISFTFMMPHTTVRLPPRILPATDPSRAVDRAAPWPRGHRGWTRLGRRPSQWLAARRSSPSPACPDLLVQAPRQVTSLRTWPARPCVSLPATHPVYLPPRQARCWTRSASAAAWRRLARASARACAMSRRSRRSRSPRASVRVCGVSDVV